MTRFARAKGSKASNQHEPESATSWQEIQQNLSPSKPIKQARVVQLGSEHIKKQKTDVEHGKVRKNIVEKSGVLPKIKHIKGRVKNVPENEGKFINKKVDDKYKRRKPINDHNNIYINGSEIEIAYFDGFPIKKTDCIRLKRLKKDMISKGIPQSEVAKALKLERRKAEKALTRQKKKVCFNCRKSYHTLAECPMLKSGPNAQLSETGICFKCGSTEHTHYECKVTRGDHFKFAQCFICKEQGHIARQCPDNSKGLYPKGGACKVCGDVTHLKKDCPKYQFEQEETKVVAHTMNITDVEGLEGKYTVDVKPKKHATKIIKF